MNAELPIMDGSSKYFVEALEKAEIEEQNAKRNIYVVKEFHSDEASGSEILVMPNDHYSVTAMVDFGTKKYYTKCNDEKYF
jgi:UDP-3-O-[3-hydroxymyristoyl] N-acetylglucosamine deacetylase/3-hydroxyacyl-[acyl-carrier-protein] dehydratase